MPVFNNLFLMVPLFMWHIGVFILKKPGLFYRYYKEQKIRNKDLMSFLRHLYLNIHILNKKTDWLHFGFATLAVDREHIARVTGAKMAVSIRGFDIAIYALKYPGVFNDTWKNVDKIHVISDALKMKMFSSGFKGDKQVVKITPAIDVDKFITNRKDYKIESGNIINILSVGRLYWKKGFEYGLEALSILKKKGYIFNYTIIGGGEEFERLKYAAYQLELLDQVFFTGVLKHEKVLEYLQKSDIYLQPSIQEGFCNAVLEAQAAGCLCVVSDAEGLSENVLHNETGWVVPRRNRNRLAEQIEYVINLPVEKKRYIINKAQQRVKVEFNIEKQVKEFIEFYEK
jgi:colanic acid/amylovoran biosynthesis glycosyltransferase